MFHGIKVTSGNAISPAEIQLANRQAAGRRRMSKGSKTQCTQNERDESACESTLLAKMMPMRQRGDAAAAAAMARMCSGCEGKRGSLMNGMEGGA